MKIKVYTAWTKGAGWETEVITECMCTSAKEFKKIVEESGAEVTSRVRIKKN